MEYAWWVGLVVLGIVYLSLLKFIFVNQAHTYSGLSLFSEALGALIGLTIFTYVLSYFLALSIYKTINIEVFFSLSLVGSVFNIVSFLNYFKKEKNCESNNDFGISSLAFQLCMNLTKNINKFIENIADSNEIDVRNITKITTKNPESCIEKYKAYQAKAWINAYFFTKSYASIVNMKKLSKGQIRQLFVEMKNLIKDTLPDYDLKSDIGAMVDCRDIDSVNTDIKYEYEGYIEDIYANNYTEEVLLNMLKNKVGDYLGLDSDSIDDFDKHYNSISSEIC